MLRNSSLVSVTGPHTILDGSRLRYCARNGRSDRGSWNLYWDAPSEAKTSTLDRRRCNTKIAGNAWEQGWDRYLSMLILISINLGILNLLPIPVLDGGQALIFAVEGIKRAPLSLRTREIFQQIGLTVLVLLMGLAFWNDLSREWAQLVEWLSSRAGS